MAGCAAVGEAYWYREFAVVAVVDGGAGRCAGMGAILVALAASAWRRRTPRSSSSLRQSSRAHSYPRLHPPRPPRSSPSSFHRDLDPHPRATLRSRLCCLNLHSRQAVLLLFRAVPLTVATPHPLHPPTSVSLLSPPSAPTLLLSPLLRSRCSPRSCFLRVAPCIFVVRLPIVNQLFSFSITATGVRHRFINRLITPAHSLWLKLRHQRRSRIRRNSKMLSGR